MITDGINFSWLVDPKNLNSQVADLTIKFEDGSVMTWDCMTWFGLGCMECVVSQMNSEQVIDMFDTFLPPTLDQVAG